MKWYIVKITITSNGAETRNLDSYDIYNTALRKFHEAFNTIGGGPKKIGAMLLDEEMNVLKREIWEAESEVE